MLELKGVTVGYGKRTVLDGVDAAFERGCLTTVVGVNGCGKSTLLKALLAMLPCRQGSALLDGEELAALTRNGIARRIAYLPQVRQTPDMTVMQLVLHGRFPYLKYPRRYTAGDRDIAHSAMEQMGICELADRPLSTLSGGMRQSAYIAMALAQDTDYILLDEPTTYLDISHQLELMRILRGLADGGKGIIAVMHDLPLAFDFSDRILLLHSGGVALQGKPREIAERSEIGEIFGAALQISPGSGRFSCRY